MKIMRATEDYLEAMLMMRNKHGYIRSIDVADYLGVTKPSVTYTTKRLKASGHITMDGEGLITLTESGMEIASKLGVDEKTAAEDACKMEHDLSDKTYNAICAHARAHMK